MDARAELRNSLRFLRFLLLRFRADRGSAHAATLTFTTLFAVVPMMTVTYSILALVPEFRGAGELIQDFIAANILPASGDELRAHLQSFAQQASKLTNVGVLFLMVTALVLMFNVERAFNDIWRIAEPRTGISSFLMYWAVLSFGPLLYGVGFVVSSYLITLPFVTETTATLGGKQQLLELMPGALTLVVITLLYMAVPNTRVPFRHALVGAVAVAAMFEAAKLGFALFVAHFTTYRLVYGAFAVVPLFLIWIYLSWVMILLGAVLVRSLSVYRRFEVEAPYAPLVGVLAVLELFWRRQREGRGADEEELLKTIPGLTQDAWEQYGSALLEARILQKTEAGDYILARDLDELSLSSLNGLLPWPLPQPDELPVGSELQFGWYLQALGRIQSAQLRVEKEFAVSLAELFRTGDDQRIVPINGTQQK